MQQIIFFQICLIQNVLLIYMFNTNKNSFLEKHEENNSVRLLSWVNGVHNELEQI